MKAKSTVSRSLIGNMWNHVPLFVKAVLGGIFVCFSGIAIWVTGYSFLPLPYSLVFVTVFLWFYCWWLRGKGWPQANSEVRSRNFRAVKLSSSTWIKGIIGALLFVVIVESSLVVTFRIVTFPEEAFKSQYPVFNTLPRVWAWALVIASSLVAGICEETGFRGYIQVPLEKRYGAIRAIFFSSLLFMLVHLSKAWAGGIVTQIFFAGILLGILAYKTGSLIPVMIGHTILDIINFSYWWSNLAGNFEKKTIGQTGIDKDFILWSLLLVFSIITFFWTMSKLKPGDHQMVSGPEFIASPNP